MNICKYPTKQSQIPHGKSYAILKEKTTSVPGDERSRTNPGHGYPAHTVESWGVELFATKEEWEAEIEKLSGRVYASKNWLPVILNRPNVKQTVTIEVETNED